jgi:sigma-B regulation protein RsbU (phosphoserine phosphatase)
VGGDFYDFFPVGKHQVAVVIGDVSGKGVPASFFMAVARTVLKGLAQSGAAPGEILAEANRTLCRENPLDLFVTVFCAVLDTSDGELIYANGGHNPPYRLGAEGAATPLALTGGVALGVMDGLTYREERITLAPGEGVLLYTDGLTEAFDTEGREYGEERLTALLGDTGELSARTLIERVTADVAAFTGEAEQSDDLTCLSLRYRGSDS